MKSSHQSRSDHSPASPKPAQVTFPVGKPSLVAPPLNPEVLWDGPGAIGAPAVIIGAV